MSFQSDMNADLDVFLADFGVTARYVSAGNSGTDITVLFDNAYTPANIGRVEVETLGPAATCKTSDVAGALHGDTLIISDISYNIIGIHPDGSGMTILLLSKD